MEEIGFLTEEKNVRSTHWAADKALNKSQEFTSAFRDHLRRSRSGVRYDTSRQQHCDFQRARDGQCGEQPLPPYGSCLLGSVNLTRFVRHPFTEQAQFDWDEYREVVKVFTRMLDNVVEINGCRCRSSARRSCASAATAWDISDWQHHHLLGMKYGSPESVGVHRRGVARNGRGRLGGGARARPREGARADHERGVHGHQGDAAQASRDGS